MTSAFLTYGNSTIHYRYSGEGPRVVICFHGFGSDARAFDWLGDQIPGHRFVAFDLPFHGETTWNNGELFTPHQLMDIIEACPQVTSPRFSLVGFSMGGKVCLQLLQEFPERTERLILIAPDGLHVNGFHWLATRTAAGRRLLKKILQHPQGLVTLVHRFATLGLANKGMIRFVERHLEDPRMRELVYRSWTSFRSFRPNPATVAGLAQEHDTPITLIYGRHDTIIPLAPGQRFFRMLRGRKHMEVLDAGHQLLHVRNAPYLAEALKL
jgi:pimeloyl-ACP methyl ester carboxylesterase